MALFEKKLAEGTATWKDAFIVPRNALKNEVQRKEWDRLMDGSMKERHAKGIYTFEELQQAMTNLRRLTRITGDPQNAAYDEKTAASLRERFRILPSKVKVLGGLPEGWFSLDGTFPNLSVVVGNVKVKSNSVASPLRAVVGNLDITDVDMVQGKEGLKPHSFPSLKSVTGNLAVKAPVSMPALEKVGGDLSVGTAVMSMPALKKVAGKVIMANPGFKAALPKETRDALRHVESGKMYKRLVEGERNSLGKDKSNGIGIK